MAVVRLSYSPAESSATVTAARLYTDPARTGTPFYAGVPTLVGGVWTFSPDLPDGDYYSAFDVTDSTGSFTDAGDFFYVQFGEVVPNSQVVSMAELRARTKASEADEHLLLGSLAASVEVIAEYIGTPLVPTVVTETLSRGTTLILSSSNVRSLTSVTSGDTAVTGYTLAPGGLLNSSGYGYGGAVTVTYVAGFDHLPAAVREALIYTVQHAYESERGAVPVPFQSSADETFTTSRGFFMPNRAKELLAPYRRGMRVA